MSSNDIKRVQMTSKEFKWNQKSPHEIKRVHCSHEIKRIHIKSKEFQWNQTTSNEIKRVQMISKGFTWNQMNSNEIIDEFTRIQMKSAKITEKCEFIGTYWEKCY